MDYAFFYTTPVVFVTSSRDRLSPGRDRARGFIPSSGICMGSVDEDRLRFHVRFYGIKTFSKFHTEHSCTHREIDLNSQLQPACNKLLWSVL
jgi:hypothetical protein